MQRHFEKTTQAGGGPKHTLSLDYSSYLGSLPYLVTAYVVPVVPFVSGITVVTVVTGIAIGNR